MTSMKLRREADRTMTTAALGQRRCHGTVRHACYGAMCSAPVPRTCVLPTLQCIDPISRTSAAFLLRCCRYRSLSSMPIREHKSHPRPSRARHFRRGRHLGDDRRNTHSSTASFKADYVGPLSTALRVEAGYLFSRHQSELAQARAQAARGDEVVCEQRPDLGAERNGHAQSSAIGLLGSQLLHDRGAGLPHGPAGERGLIEAYFAAHRDHFTETTNVTKNQLASYNGSETIYSSYAMNTTDFGALHVNVGLRSEITHSDYTGHVASKVGTATTVTTVPRSTLRCS